MSAHLTTREGARRDTARNPTSDSHCWLTLGSERTDKYSFNSLCNLFRRTTQQPQRSPESSHEPSSQEGIAAVLGKLSRAIQPRGDCLDFRTRLWDSIMTTPPHAFTSTKQSAGGKGQQERGGSALRGHLLSVQILFSKCRLFQPLRLNDWWELFQLSNWSLKQSASGG